MLHILALAAATAAPATVSADWLQSRLNNADVRVIYVGDLDAYQKGHIPGARAIDHMATVAMGENGHRLASNDAVAKALAKAGAVDGKQDVLYGDSPMATAWVFSAFAAIGHGDEVSWLDGGYPTWQKENRPT